MDFGFWLLIILVILLLVVVAGVKIVSQSKAYVIERLGAYHRTMQTGLHYVVPILDRVASCVSLKEMVKDFAPQPVITKDNVTMQIDTVVYYQITDPKLYTYGVENPISAIENLTATTLRNIIGDLELDETLTSRDVINTKMRSILDEATDAWGIKVHRVEVKNILPPRDIQEAMEKQMRAERERREAILRAEGEKKSQILIAEGEKESTVLRAEAAKEAKIKEAEGEAQSIVKIQEATAQGLRLIKDVGMDDGDIIRKEEVDIGEDETSGELWNRLSTLGAKMLVQTLKDIEKGNVTRIKQPEEFTLAPKLEKEMSKIDWENKTVFQIKNLVRGLNPGFGAYSILEGKKIKFWKINIINFDDFINKFSEFEEYKNRVSKISNGTVIYSSDKDGLFIKAKDAIISVVEIQGENSKKMNIKDYLRGNKIEAGQCFQNE